MLKSPGFMDTLPHDQREPLPRRLLTRPVLDRADVARRSLWARDAALVWVHHGAAAVLAERNGVDGRAAGQRQVRLRRAAVVRQGSQIGVRIAQIKRLEGWAVRVERVVVRQIVVKRLHVNRAGKLRAVLRL